jgi:hypothetical protein
VVQENNSTRVFNQYNRRILLPAQNNWPSAASILKLKPKYIENTCEEEAEVNRKFKHKQRPILD